MRRLVQQMALLAVISLVGGGGPTLAIDLLDECREFKPMAALISKQIERPKPPLCAASFISFSDQYQFQTCRSEMQDYQAKIERYGKCLEHEYSEAVSDLNGAIESFNRLASR